ncbi:ribosome biogenesis protein NOP53 [Megalobrama amblycephala]|uniref:ribosome biogenesis protein NOP53 n=1 Tax=Megalobrama amblycephala TaxID=75352 RepID=UPI0020147859|nr:ribosome biogenesis protein NOP53 [Megalobrama amblycephala]XP_048017353.1 ribosome biogenesis protein NOP53 [Megalobrama amblycephala]
MAAARRHKRVAASQPGFLPLKSDLDGNSSDIKRRKRVNKNKKKNWNKYSDIQDVEEFLEDVRLQEKAVGGLIAEKPDDSLFFVDTGEKDKDTQPQTTVKKGKRSKPLRIDLILRPDSLIPAPKNVLAFQQPNAKKQRRMAEKAAKLAAMGVVPRREKLLQLRRAAAASGLSVKEKPVANNNPERAFYDLWSAGAPETADPYFLEQTKKKLVKRPDRLNEKPSVLPAIEVVAPGASYNPDFFSHQDLLREAHEVEVKKLKAEERLKRQLAVNEDIATKESNFKEQVEGLIEEGDSEPEEPEGDAEDTVTGPTATQEKKTERERKKEKAQRIKELQTKAERQKVDKQQQLFQLRSIRSDLKKQEQRTKMRQAQRKAKQEAQKSTPRRLGRLKFQAPDLDIQLSDELAGSLRSLKPEGSILKDRFKSLQKRNLIEPRERAKFKRKYKLKYTEKRAFREIQ